MHSLPIDASADAPQGQCFHSLMVAQAAQTPDAAAILAPDRAALTYRCLQTHVAGVITTLNRMGLGRGDRVALVLPNGPELAAAFLAVAAGATCAPLNPAYRDQEFDFYLSDLNARALIIQSGMDSPALTVAQDRGIPILELLPAIEAPAGIFTLSGARQPPPAQPGPAQPDDHALVLHTSGTTSRPKIVPLTHRNLCASAGFIRSGLELVEGDRCLNVMPLFHIHGLVGALLSSLSAGASVVCTPGFSAPSFFEWLERFRPTWYTAVPTMHQAILARAPSDRALMASSRLRFIRSCSSPLPPQVMTEMERVFSRPVIEAYGMTEAAHQMASNPLPPRQRKPGSVGVAAGPEVAVMGEAGRLLAPGETGEIVIRGPNVTDGYENNPLANQDAFTAGWFRTGDQGYLDEGGYLFLTGRIKEMINRAGEKISPREVDEALLDHPAIAQAVTFPVPHASLGESVAAAVVLRPKAAATEREIREFVAARLADFKVPRQVLIVDEIPKGPTGKPQRIGLAEKLKLIAFDDGRPAAVTAFAAARTPLERALANIWARVLGLERIGISDSFFQWGGDSLLATQLVARVREAMGVELPLLSLFEEASDVAGMARRIEELQLTEPSRQALPLVPRAGEGEFRPSFSQERLWFVHQIDPTNSAYNRPFVLRLTGSLNQEALRRSLDEILRRHAVLRATFPSAGGRPSQVIAPVCPVSMPVVDLSDLPEGEREARALGLAREAARKPFDLTAGPVLRTAVVRLGHEEHFLMLTVHHVVFDASSLRIFLQEMAALYGAFGAGKPSPLPELTVQYSDFAHWQRQWFRSEGLEGQLSYWKQQLAGAPTLLELPTDRPRSPVQTANGAQQSYSLPRSLSEPLKALGRQERATLFMTLLAAFQVLLSRYTCQDDFVVGVPIAGRTRGETEALIGFFANTLPLRADLSGNPSFRELLRRTRQVALGAYSHQELPFEKLVEALQPQRDLSRTPLVQVMFQITNAPRSRPVFPGLKVEEVAIDPGTAKFDLSVEVVESEPGLSLRFEYNTDLFEAATMTRMMGHYRRLLEGIVADPEQRVSTLPLLTEAEQHQLLSEWNDTRIDYPRDQCLHQLFEAQVARTPEALAVVSGDQQWTYRELNVRANRLAHALRKRGVGPEVRVGLCVQRSAEMVAGLLGILKAGGAYVPLDPSSPRERLAFMLRDARVPLLLTQARLLANLPESVVETLLLDARDQPLVEENLANPAVPVTASNLAYVIYTSGSTGVPKGVDVEHASVVNLVTWHQRVYSVTPEDRATQLAGPAFDAAVWELWPYLTAGASVHLPDEETRLSPARLREWLTAEGITLCFVPTPLAQPLLEESWPDASPLRALLIGGDRLQRGPEKPLPFLAFNHYGPTENTVVTTWSPIASRRECDAPPPIGRPIANTQVYLLDAHLQPAPVGVTGELYISGEGLARGYLDRPELTAAQFIPHPLSDHPGARLYRTGDLARYLPDGQIEFLGRRDHQVKVRGFRVERGEIEAVLSRHPAVREAVVLAEENNAGEQRLVAYLVAGPAQAPTTSDLRRFVQAKLPEFMVPSNFVFLEALPLTPNGKIDRRALPEPGRARPELEGGFVAPRTPVEAALAEIWCALLRLEHVGIDDNFFEVGGHSLLATQVLSRVQTAFHIKLPLRCFFDRPTVAGLAEAIRKNGDGPRPAPPLARVSREGHRVQRSASGAVTIPEFSSQPE